MNAKIENLASNIRVNTIGNRMYDAARFAHGMDNPQKAHIANVNLLHAYLTAGLVCGDCVDRARETVAHLEQLAGKGGR